MSIKRRDFLKIAGGISLSLPLTQCSIDRLSDAALKSSWFTEIEGWTPTVCQACSGGCGLLVRKIDDRAVKVEGNPLHPLNRGKVCAKGQAGLQLLYNPDRIPGPMQKIGDRHNGSWKSISWEEADSLVSSKLGELRKTGQSHTVVYIGDSGQNSSDMLVDRFLSAYGTPNNIKRDPWIALKQSYFHSQGIDDLLGMDMHGAKYILSFGADFLNNWPNSLEMQRLYGEKRAARSVKIVHVESQFSLSAARADRWIPINPGTEGLLALGIASVIIKERLYDTTYLKRFADRFEDWSVEKSGRKKGYKNEVLEKIRLDQISELTGVPLKNIIEIAKEFSTLKPSVAVADYNLSFFSNGLFNIQAVHTLNALLGNIDTPGGLIRQRRAPLASLPTVELDNTAQKALAQPRIDGINGGGNSPQKNGINNFVDNVVNQKSYQVNCLLLSNNNTLLSSPIAGQIKQAFQKIPFIVSFSTFWNEESHLADVILPDTTYFEKWQEIQSPPLSLIPVVGIGQPVVAPRYQSRPLEETILSLAKQSAAFPIQNFPWASFKELLFHRIEGLFDSQQGCVFTGPNEEAQLRLLEERGWWTPQHNSKDAFMQDLLKKGGWQDPSWHYNQRGYVYQNPSRKFEFFTSIQIQEILPRFSGDESEYPFKLCLYDLPFNSDALGENIPWYQESQGFRFNLAWKTWVNINPESAEKLNIHDKDMVWVESPFGKIKALAKVFAGIVPDVLGIPLGKAETVPGQKSVERKNDPLVLCGDSVDERTGILSRMLTRVKIYPYTKRGIR